MKAAGIVFLMSAGAEGVTLLHALQAHRWAVAGFEVLIIIALGALGTGLMEFVNERHRGRIVVDINRVR